MRSRFLLALIAIDLLVHAAGAPVERPPAWDLKERAAWRERAADSTAPFFYDCTRHRLCGFGRQRRCRRPIAPVVDHADFLLADTCAKTSGLPSCVVVAGAPALEPTSPLFHRQPLAVRAR